MSSNDLQVTLLKAQVNNLRQLKTHFSSESRKSGTGIWPFRSGWFGLSRFGLSRFGLVDSVWPIRSGRFGHGTFRSVYEILQKSYINAKSSRLLQSALPPSSYCMLPNVEAFHSKRTTFTILNSGKRCRQVILLSINFLVIVQSNWISGVSGLARVFDYDL